MIGLSFGVLIQTVDDDGFLGCYIFMYHMLFDTEMF